MATTEIYAQDSKAFAYDDINVQLLNVTLIQHTDNETFANDGHSLQIIPAPIISNSDSLDVGTVYSDDVATELLDAPVVHEVNAQDSQVFAYDDIYNQIIPAPIVNNSDSLDVATAYSDDVATEFQPVPPRIVSIEPSGTIYTQFPEFRILASSTDPCKIDLEIYSTDNWQIFAVFGADMTKIQDNDYLDLYEYRVDFRYNDYDMLLFGDYVIKARVYNNIGGENDQQNFTIRKQPVDIRITQIERDHENDRLIVDFEIDNKNRSWVSLYPILTNGRVNKKFDILQVNALDGGRILFNEKGIFALNSEDINNFRVVLGYETESEFTEIASLLNQKIIRLRYQCLVYDIDGNEHDVTEFVKSISYSISTELASRQANIEFVQHQLLCPYTNISTPLFYGNKIIFKTILETDNGSREFIEYIGYIKTVDSSNEGISVIALDRLSVFSQRLNEDLHYAPNKIRTGEYLKTTDGIKFKSSHKGWAQLPAPKIFVDGKLKTKGEYVVDYYRGEIYLSANPYLDPEWIDQIVDMNEVDDRQTIELYGSINLSSSLKVKLTYMEKQDYSCVSGVECEQVWLEKTVELIEGVDYSVDYENKKLKLTNPVPVDSDTRRNYFLTISYRKDVDSVYAEYSYFEAGTNEVEQITEDLALRLGFSQEDLEDEYAEYLYSEDGFSFMTRYKNIKEVLEFKVDGQDYSDYEIIGGKIQTNSVFPSNEVIIDPFESIYFFSTGEDTQVSLDFNDKYFGDCSVKIEYNGSDRWAQKRWGSGDITLDLSMYREVAFMVKTSENITLNIEFLSGEGFLIASESFNLTAGDWQKIVIDLSGIDYEDRSQIGSVRFIPSDNTTLWIDYMFVPSHEVFIRYKYGTLQPTGVSINEVWFNKGETDTYKDILEEIYKQVDPSYMLYIDKQEKLRGEYKKLMPYYINLLQNRIGEHKTDYYGAFTIPDYSTPMLSSFRHTISEEQLFSAVMVIGRLSQKPNVALLGVCEDVCDVVDGVSYIRTTYYTPKTGNYSVDTVLNEMLEQQGIEPLPPPAKDAKTVIDSNSESGMYWYVKKHNDASRPFSNQQLMLALTLPEPVKWEEINVLVGIFKNYVIREELYIEVETEDGERFFPEEDNPTKKQGQSGTWLSWKNQRFKNKKIKRVYVYCSESARWITSKQVVGGGKK